MSKISYLRKRIIEEYNNGELKTATTLGETLIREHIHNNSTITLGYADDVYNLAVLYDEMGDLDKALELYTTSGKYVMHVEGESVNTVKRLNQIAVIVCRHTQNYDSALLMFRHINEILKNQVGNQDARYADNLYNIGNLMAEKGKRKEALCYHIEALNIRQQKGTNNDMLNSLFSIAFLHEDAKEYDKAIKYAEKAITFTKGNEEIASSCHYLAELYESNEQREKAIPLYEKVLEAIRKQVGERNGTYLNVAFRRANSLARLERTHEAIDGHSEICEIFQHMTTSNHIFYANSLRNLAILHKQLGENDLAKSYAIKSLKMRKSTTDDMLTDVIFLIKLYLENDDQNPDITKSIETIIYFLMHKEIDEDDINYYMEITSLCEALLNDNHITLEDCVKTLELMMEHETLATIVQKWTV